MTKLHFLFISYLLSTSMSCNNRSERVSERGNSAVENIEPAPPATNSANASVTDQQAYLGIRSFAEIVQTFATVTGVTPNDATMKQYDLVRFTLPSETNDIRSFNASHQAAIVKLASEFCRQLVATDSYKADMQTLAITFNDRFMADQVAQAKVGRYFAEKFWSLASGDSDFSIAEQEAKGLVAEFDKVQGFNSNNAAFGICTAVLASFQTLEK